MSLTQQLAKQLKRDEGLVLHAYEDSEGWLTIGFGRLIDQRKGGGITEHEALFLFTNDLDKVRTGVLKHLPWASSLDEARLGVLLNMAFQMGVEGLLGFAQTLAEVKARNWEGAARGMKRSKWFQQTPMRAERLITQMKTGVWQ